MLIGLCVGCGLVQVAWRNAIVTKSYQVGERINHLARSHTDLGRLTTHVAALESPVHLARIAEERKLELVGWSPLPSGESATGHLVHMAEVAD